MSRLNEWISEQTLSWQLVKQPRAVVLYQLVVVGLNQLQCLPNPYYVITNIIIKSGRIRTIRQRLIQNYLGLPSDCLQSSQEPSSSVKWTSYSVKNWIEWVIYVHFLSFFDDILWHFATHVDPKNFKFSKWVQLVKVLWGYTLLKEEKEITQKRLENWYSMTAVSNNINVYSTSRLTVRVHLQASSQQYSCTAVAIQSCEIDL